MSYFLDNSNTLVLFWPSYYWNWWILLKVWHVWDPQRADARSHWSPGQHAEPPVRVRSRDSWGRAHRLPYGDAEGSACCSLLSFRVSCRTDCNVNKSFQVKLIHDQCSMRPRYRGFFDGVGQIVREQGKTAGSCICETSHACLRTHDPLNSFRFEGHISRSDSHCSETRKQPGHPVLRHDLFEELVQRWEGLNTKNILMPWFSSD